MYPLTESRITDALKSNNRPPRHKRGERFLLGPIPLAWLRTAANLPGKTFVVAVLMWFEAGVSKSDTVTLGHRRLGDFGVHRAASYSALEALENAGLVCVKRHPGRSPRVTLLHKDGANP